MPPIRATTEKCFNYLTGYRWTLTLVLGISFLAGWWTFRVLDRLGPLWTVKTGAANIYPVGFTHDDLLVTFETHRGKGTFLITRQASTGNITATVPLNCGVVNTGRLSRDEQWVHLRVLAKANASAGRNTLCSAVVSRDTGQLRCPIIEGDGSISPNGRFLSKSKIVNGQPANGEIIDLTTGSPIAAPPGLTFAPDGERGAMLMTDGPSTYMVFYSLPEGNEIARTLIPDSHDENLWISSWREHQIEFVRSPRKSTSTSKGRSSLEIKIWKYRIIGTQLFNGEASKTVPAAATAGSSNSYGTYSYYLNFPRPLADCVRYWNNQFRNTRFPTSLKGWQQWDRVTGQPIGDVINISDLSFRLLSDDGRWMAATKDRMSVWALPAYQNPWRGTAALGAAMIPWLLWFVFLRVRRVRVPC